MVASFRRRTAIRCPPGIGCAERAEVCRELRRHGVSRCPEVSRGVSREAVKVPQVPQECPAGRYSLRIQVGMPILKRIWTDLPIRHLAGLGLP